MSISALVFDVDGTMADTEEAHRCAFNAAFEDRGLGWVWSRDDYRELLKVSGGKERIAAYISTLNLSTAERKRLMALLPTLHADKTRIYTGVVADGAVPLRDGVKRLCDEALGAGCLLAIASTTSSVNIDALLGAAFGPRGIDRFSVIACGDQVRAKKPAPDIYRLALRHLELDADQVVAFEDSAHGLQAAQAAGIWTVVTPNFWTEDSDFSGAGLLLPQLGDPSRPLSGEPGGRLHDAAWLTLAELERRAPPRVSAFGALQAGARA